MIKRNTQIMLGVFALLLIVFLVVRNAAETGEGETEDLPTPVVPALLFDFDPADVTGIRIENLDGQAVQVRQEGEVWLLVQPPAPAEQTDLTRIENLVAALGALQLVTQADLEAPLNVVGLEFAPYLLTLTLADGTVHEVAIGDASVTGTGYYISVDGGLPQLATKSVLDQFIGLLDSPPLLPTPIPELPTETPAGDPGAAATSQP